MALVQLHAQPILHARFDTVKSGELAGATSATQFPDVGCEIAWIEAAKSNTGKVYIGASGVTKADGGTDTTTGFELNAGESIGPLPIGNLNQLYYIADAATDDLIYFVLR